jgi:hypothetical protein
VTVQYFDGELDLHLAPQHVKKFVPYAVGESVEVKTSEYGEFQSAEVRQAVTNGKVKVKLSDSKRIISIVEPWVRRATYGQDGDAQVGDIVECPYEGSDALFQGTVVKRNDDGSYHVKFFDGDEDFEVPASDIFILD